MPARKPSSLSKRHNTKAERQARQSAENSLTPATELTIKPPRELHGHKIASDVWRRLIGLYRQADGKIITAFDLDLLVKYCLAEEELLEVAKLRNELKALWLKHTKILAKISPDPEYLKDYFNALSQANALLQRFQGMDARMDGKRKLVFSLAQSMYLTPRSRAGVAPPERPEEPEKDEMEKLLDGD